MAHPITSGRWRVQIRRKGSPKEQRIFDDQAAAERWERTRLAQLLTSKTTSATGPTLENIVRRYLDSHRFRQKSPGTQSRERCCSKAVLYMSRTSLPNPNTAVKDLGPTTPRSWNVSPVDSLDGRDIQDYIDARGAELAWQPPHRAISPDCIRLEVRFLSAVFKFAVQNRLRETNPALGRVNGFSIPSSNQRDTRISPEQEQVIVMKAYSRIRKSPRANPSLFPWLELVRTTGCRPGEAAKIELTWVELEKRVISVPRRSTKRRQPRRVLLTEHLANVLAPQLLRAEVEGSPYLFFSRDRKSGAFKPYAYAGAWRALRAAAGTRVEPHGMRREHISRLFENTSLSDSQVALLVGDVNPLSLNPYRHLRAEKIRPQFTAFQDAQTKERQLQEASLLRRALRDVEAAGVTLNAQQRAFLKGPLKLRPPKIDPAGDRDVEEILASFKKRGRSGRPKARVRSAMRKSA